MRTIWRIILYLLIGVVVFLPFIPILKILPLDTSDKGPTSIVNLVFVLFLGISFLLAGWIALRWIDRRPPALLGLNFWLSSLRELLIGIGIGLTNFGVVFLILLVCGWISTTWTGFAYADIGRLGLSIASFFVFASIEELINRGYPFQALCEGVGVVAAAITISLIFSLVHIMNPAFSILGGVFLFIHGLLYTVAYLKTRSLWTPIGLHMAWNCAQGPIAGMKISGTSANISFFLTDIKGPEVVTGGSFGIEGGLIAIFVSIVILMILLKARWLTPSVGFLDIERKWVGKSTNQAELTISGHS